MERVIKLLESKILPGQLVSVKLQFDNPNTMNVRSSSDMEEKDLKPFTYTYSEHGIVLATKDDPEADDILKSDSQAFIKEAWTSLKRVEAEHRISDFIPLEPELRTMRYNTYRNGYVRFEYGYSLLYLKGDDIHKLDGLQVGDQFLVAGNTAVYEILNRTAIDNGYEQLPDTPFVPEGIIFELEQITNKPKVDLEKVVKGQLKEDK
jgi:hypothetical protein